MMKINMIPQIMFLAFIIISIIYAIKTYKETNILKGNKEDDLTNNNHNPFLK